MTDHRQFNPQDLLPHWLLTGALLTLLIAANIACHIWPEQIRLHIDAEQRLLLKSIFYAVTIILFPLVKLLRHILLRLNQTMPGKKTARRRYFQTVTTCLLTVSWIGGFGVLMFILGDDYNTLSIFSLLAGLGIFLHKPDIGEYRSIYAALILQNTDLRT